MSTDGERVINWPLVQMSSANQDQRTPPSGLGLKILCVEDDDEIREALVVVLSDAGYEVTAAENAPDGLAAMERRPYHLVITDYALPGQTGAWMLEEGARRDLLGDAAAVIVTAYRDIAKPDGVRVFHKPLDLDQFIAQVGEMLLPARKRELQRSADGLEQIAGAGRGRDGDPRIELVLYVSGSSPSSLKAMRNLEAVLRRFEATSVRLEMCDLARGYPPAAEEDRIAFTPTLVKRAPAPRAWIVGNLDNRELVADLLLDAGVEPKEA
jgi:CheY-like chemotaxis protein